MRDPRVLFAAERTLLAWIRMGSPSWPSDLSWHGLAYFCALSGCSRATGSRRRMRKVSRAWLALRSDLIDPVLNSCLERGSNSQPPGSYFHNFQTDDGRSAPLIVGLHIEGIVVIAPGVESGAY